ncbi:MAG: hypothetical protein MUQ27_00750, partial [Acidimicrobiia bacterium]|nr:hypothetical protein [Acidimicrobiia bacterium]
MSTYTRAEAAEGAGVSLDYLDQLVELRIVQPAEFGQFSSGDVRRMAMVQSLEDVGVPLDGLAATISRGELSLGFLDAPAYERFSSLGGLTFQELSDQTGVPVDLLMVVR